MLKKIGWCFIIIFFAISGYLFHISSKFKPVVQITKNSVTIYTTHIMQSKFLLLAAIFLISGIVLVVYKEIEMKQNKKRLDSEFQKIIKNKRGNYGEKRGNH